MAGTKALNVRMNFQVDTTQARQQIQQLGAQLNSITKASNFSVNSSLGITQEILQATKAAAQLKTTLAEAINPLTGNLNLSAFNDQLIASKMSLMDYRNQLSALGTVGNQTFNSLTRSIMTAETPLLRTGKAAQQMWTVLGNTIRWQATSSMIHGIMGTASQAMNYVKSLDSSLNSIRIVTGQNQAQMERFAQTANKAAKDLNTTTNAYAKASLIYYQQGLSNEEVEKRVATTVKLANVSGQTAAKVSDQLTAIWNNFYDGSKSLEYYADVMTALGASTASSTDEIAKGLEKFSSIAKTTGLSYEYATSALSTVVAATRQSADSVGTSFKTLFSRLQGLSLGETLDDGTTLNKYSKALNVIGVNIKNANGSLKDMDRILDEIGDKWTTLSKSEQVALAQTVGGARNYTGLVSLMDNWDSFQTNLKTAQQAQGTLQNQADIYAQSWEAASNHVRVASETIYKNLLDDKFFKGMTNMFGYFLDGIGEVTNQMGGFKGVMSGLANFAFTTFAPQISKSFANIGSSIYGITPQGQEKVLDLRRQAMNAVTANVRLSEYGAVDKLAHDYNQAFVNRQVAYDNAVQKGKISEYQTPVYQTLLTNMGQSEDAVIRQAEAYYRNQEATNLQAGRYATAANAAIVAAGKQNGTNINIANWKDIGLQNRITAYQTALTREENAASLLQYYRKGDGNYGIQDQNFKAAATGLQRMALGAKAIGQDLDKTLPGLGQFHTQLEALGGDVTKLTQDQLRGLLDENTRIGQYLTAATRSSDDTATVTSSLILDGIKNYVTDQLKLDINTDEGKATLDKVMTAVTAKDLNISERAALLQKAGLTEQQQRGILGDIEGQTVPQTIAMSSALSTNIGMLASLGQMYTGVSNAIKTFGDENATAGQQVASLTSLAMAGSMAFKPFSNFIATAGKEVTIFGKGLGMTNGVLGAAMAGIAAAAVVTSAVVKDLHKNSLAGAIENYNTALATSTQLASNAKNAYDQLITSSETHNNLLTNIQSLRQGTQEFTLALLDANDAANNIIENHDLIYGQDYTYNQQGAIEFKEGVIDKTIEQAEAEMIRTSVGRQQLAYSKQILDTSADNSKAVKKEGYNRTYTDNLLEFLAPNGAYENISLQELVENIQRRSSENGQFIFDENGNEGHWQYNTENWLKDNFSVLMEESGFGKSGYQLTNEGLQQLSEILGTSNEEETLQHLQDLIDISSNSNLTNEDINTYLGENYISQREFKNRAAIQGLVDVTISGVQDTIKNSDLVSTIVANSLMQGEMATDIAKIVNQESVKTFFANGENDPKEWYKKLYGKDPEGLSEEELYSYVAEGLTNEIILHGGSSSVLKGADSILNTLKGFDGVLTVAKDLEKLNLPNLENLNYQQITSEFDKILDYEYFSVQGKQQRHLKDTETNKAIQEYRDYAKQIYDNQLNDLATAMLRGIGDGLLNGITETEEGSIFQERVTALAGQITDNGKEIMSSLTYGALKQATNAMINANEIGESTANTMYSLLLRGRTQNGGFDADTLTAIQNYNFDNTIASIYSNNNLKRYAANQAQRDKYIELFSSQIEAIEKEKGWFQMLYNSSGFSDVLDKINSQFQSTGQITAQYITDLASKSEELSQFLKVSSDSAGLLNVNAGGLAAIFEEINRGTSGLTSTNISSDFIKAVSHGASQQNMNATAFETVDNLDISRASSDLMDYFQDAGKAWYGIKQSGQGFYSDRMQDLIRLYGNDETRKVYQEALSHKDWNFNQMWNYMVKNDTSGFTSSMETYAGVKKGKAKGGGGPDDVWSQAYDILGIDGLTPEEQSTLFEELGLEVTKNGSVYLNKYGNETSEEILNNLVERAKAKGMDETAAKDFFTVAMGLVTNSGQTGNELARRGAEKGEQDLLAAENPVNEEALKAYFDQYGTILGYGTDEDSYKRFKDDFRTKGGQIGVSLSKEEWQGISTTEDLVKKAQEQGIMQNYSGGPVAITNFRQLADVYGAVTTGGQLDYDKLVTMIGSMGGTEEDLIKLLENNTDLVNSLVASDNAGNEIKREEGESLRGYVNRIHESQGDVEFKYSGLSSEAANMAYMYEHMVMSQNEDGTWSWHYETQKDKDRKVAEEQHKVDVAKRQQLKEQFGYSDTDIDEAITLGSDYDTLINNAQAAEDQKKKEEAEQAELERRADVLNLTTDQVQEYDQLRADLGESSINIDTYKAYQAYKEANPDYEGSWMDWHDAGMPEPKKPPVDLEYIGEKVEEKVDTLTPDDRSLGERIGNYTEGVTTTAKTVAGAIIGAILNPFGVKAEGEELEGAGEDVIVSNPDLNTDRTVIPASRYHGTVLLSDAGEYETARAYYDSIDAQGAFQAFRDAVWGAQGSPMYSQHDITSDEQAELDRLKAEVDNAQTILDTYDDEIMAGETGTGITRGEALGISKEEAEANVLNAQEKADLYTYQNTMSPAERLAAITDAQTLLHTEGADKLTPFQKFLMNAIGEIDEHTGTLVEYGEGEEGSDGKKKQAHVDENTGELVDEEGNPIELPEGQQPQGGSSGDGGSNGDSGGGGSGGGSGSTKGPSVNDRKAAGGAFVQGLLDGKFGNGQTAFTFGGQTYGVVRNDSGVITGYSDSKGNVTSIDDAAATVALASGQNNARLLAYASGKEGHIAVTGELGPELRVKSDGSMDILGKTGREYAWVEPDDRIYTASQSAGILKSNKIPGLEGLAKGINNYIPGYEFGRGVAAEWSSSGSSSSGRGGSDSGSSRGGSAAAATPLEEEKKDPRYDPNTLKIRDVLERYYTILQKIDDITRAVEKFAKVADRAWGQDRIKAIEKQTALYQQQYDAQKKYVQEIGEYMNTDTMALTTMIREFVDSYNEGKEEADKITWAGAQFDSNGVLTNYREFVEKLVEKFNAGIGANAQVRGQSKEAQYKFQEQLKDIQMYTDTLNLWESETDKLQELADQILDNSLKEITYRVEYELELNADQKRLLDFHDSFVKDDMFRIAEHISNINEEIANTVDNLEKTREGIYDYFGTLAGENMRVGAFYDDVALGLATRDEKGVMNAKSYEDVNFVEVSENLDKWLAELREKDEKSAEEVDKIIKRNEEGLIINYRDTLNKINEMNQQLSNDSISLLLTDVQTFFNQISDLTNNPQWTGLSTEMKDQITNYMDQMIQYIQAMGDQFKEIIESMGDSIKAFGKKMDAEVDEFDYYGDVYKSFGNIIDLTNQHMTDITSEFFKTLNSKALDNNINKIEVARRRYEIFKETFRQVSEQYNEMLERVSQAPNGSEEQAFYQQRADELKEQFDIARSQMESEYKELLQAWEDALSKAQESYKQAMEKASKDFEENFSPLFNTLALLQAQFDREKALGDLYVDNYQRIHDLNKLDRDIQNSIDDTDNLRGKQRLRDLQAEINQLQEDGNDLSEYDLDILDKKYKLELARQALEDAKDAKSMVRLARDNNGNWSYVYTANQDDVDKAEQDYEDAIREMEQANEDYIKNIQDQIVQVQQEAQQAILALQPEDFATYDDYLMAVQNIQNSMYQTLDYLRSQMNNAFGNNRWLENYIPNIIQDHGLTDDFGDTILSNLLANDNLNSAIQNAKNNFENNLIAPALEAFTLYSEKQKEVYIAAGKDITTIGQSFGEEMDQLTDKSEEQVKIVMDLADRVETTFGDAMVEVIDATNDWLDKIKDVVAEYDILLAKITELKKIDGEYIEPAKMINGDNAIDDWAEIDRFKRELRDNGILNVITTDTETGKEKSTQYIAADTENINAFLKDASIAAAKKDIDQFDLGDDGVDDAENSKVKAYLAQHGYVWVKYKGEELMFSSEEEWNAWYEKHKPAPPAANEPDGWWRNPYIVGGFTNDELAHWGGLDTGGYTGRWQSADTGMYTGEWPSGSVRRNGRLAWLHQKELVLNAHDTENFLDAMQIVRQLDNLTNWMANGLGDLIMPNVSSEMGELEQNVHIEAEFPNVTDHNEIEQAFNNLVNMASQYANRK